MADKPSQTTIYFDRETVEWLQDLAFANKRKGRKELDSISKIVRQAVDELKKEIESK